VKKSVAINYTPHEASARLAGSTLLVRPMKVQPPGDFYQTVIPCSRGSNPFYWEFAKRGVLGSQDCSVEPMRLESPFGTPGTLLVGRERWSVPPDLNKVAPQNIWDPHTHIGGGVVALPNYKIDYPSWDPWPGTKWRPAFHMPRWAVRLLDRVVKVEVRRVQTVTEEEAFASGIPRIISCPGCHGDEEGCCVCEHSGRVRVGGMSQFTAHGAFQDAFDSSQGKGSWDLNPWAWFITTEPVARANAEAQKYLKENA